jgi:hypothetical protein
MQPMTIEEMDSFFANIDFVPEEKIDAPHAHMSFITSRQEKKNRNTPEETPMYYYRGRWFSAQRISFFLFKNIDPVKKANIVTLCGKYDCVNPQHLSLVQDDCEELF